MFVEFGKDQNYGRKTSTQKPDASGKVEILLAGMQPTTTYHMRAVVVGTGGIDDMVVANGKLQAAVGRH